MTVINIVPPKASDGLRRRMWGPRVGGAFEELDLLFGHADMNANKQVLHPHDSLAQAREALLALHERLTMAGYGVEDMIYLVVTISEEFDLRRNFWTFSRLWAEVFAGKGRKPGLKHFRVVDALSQPDLLVEVEVLAAR